MHTYPMDGAYGSIEGASPAEEGSSLPTTPPSRSESTEGLSPPSSSPSSSPSLKRLALVAAAAMMVAGAVGSFGSRSSLFKHTGQALSSASKSAAPDAASPGKSGKIVSSSGSAPSTSGGVGGVDGWSTDDHTPGGTTTHHDHDESCGKGCTETVVDDDTAHSGDPTTGSEFEPGTMAKLNGWLGGWSGSNMAEVQDPQDPQDPRHWNALKTNGDGYGDVVSLPTEEEEDEQDDASAMKGVEGGYMKGGSLSRTPHPAHVEDLAARERAGMGDMFGSDDAEAQAEAEAEAEAGGEPVDEAGPFPAVMCGGKVACKTDAPSSAPTSEGTTASNGDNSHILFILLDDVGYNDMLGTSSDMSEATSFMHSMAEKGVSMTRYYAEHSCTPGRAAILTGRYVHATGMAYSMVYWYSEWGLPQKYPLISDVLADYGGYQTHMIGKWDIGMYAPTQWPTERGFETFLGLLVENFDYNTHTCCNNGTSYDEESEVIALSEGMDGYDYNSGDYDHYSTNMFGSRTVEIINDHKPNEAPMFIYLSFNAPHTNVALPDWSEDGLDFTETSNYTTLQDKLGLTWAKRKVYASALNLVDYQVERIYKALNAKGYLGGGEGDTTIVVTSDNGAPSKTIGGVNGGSNWPLRGVKGHFYDGGYRVPAFVFSSLIEEDQRGAKIDTLFHSTDWLNTLVNGPAQLNVTTGDGYNMWHHITGADTTVQRTNVPMGLDYKNSEGALVLYTHGSYYKIMMYKVCDGWWAPWDGNATTSPYAEEGESVSDDMLDGWCDEGTDGSTDYKMYDLSDDPSETTNIYNKTEYVGIQRELEKLLCSYWRPAHDGGPMVDSAYTRENAYNDFFQAAYHNNRYATYWKETENSEQEYRYPMFDYFSTLDICASDVKKD